jgi:hypothetical protein
MFTTTTRTQKTVFAAAAVAVTAFGLSLMSSSFIPADPRVEIARGQAVLDRVEQVRQAQALQEGLVKTAEVKTIVR